MDGVYSELRMDVFRYRLYKPDWEKDCETDGVISCISVLDYFPDHTFEAHALFDEIQTGL
jgi:hypothetical protein